VKLLSQQNPLPTAHPEVLEFPVTLQQDVVAGKTAVGTKIRANQMVATLFNGKVIPIHALQSQTR
jgi:hypothetical protein